MSRCGWKMEFLSLNHPDSLEGWGLLLCEGSRQLGIVWVSDPGTSPAPQSSSRQGARAKAGVGGTSTRQAAPSTSSTRLPAWFTPPAPQQGTEQSWSPRPGQRRHIWTRETMKWDDRLLGRGQEGVCRAGGVSAHPLLPPAALGGKKGQEGRGG